jgi:hypothetical protein
MAAMNGRVLPVYFTILGTSIAITLTLHALGIGIGALGGLFGKNAARTSAPRGY